MSAAPVSTALPNSPPRPVEIALLASVFIIAACGLLYELAAGAIASYLLGDSVLQFSTIIGAYLFAMGVGSWLSRFFERQLPAHFLRIELLVALAGGALPAMLFLANAYTPGAFRFLLYALVFLVGMLVGLEIPLVMRILKRNVALKDLVSQVLTFDYLGALAVSVAFPLVLVPHLGMIRTGLLFGLMNATVALWALWLFRHELRRFGAHALACVLTLAVLLAGFAAAGTITTLTEDKFYTDHIVFTAASPYQRIVVTNAPGEGRAGHRLFLNGNLQFAERDEYRYHEALVHPVMAAHGAPRQVAVLGGGDGMAVREVLRGADAAVILLGPHPNAAKPFCATATKAIIAGMRTQDVPRILCVTGAMIGEQPGNVALGFKLMSFGVRKTGQAEQLEDRDQQERVVRTSKLQWTVIKPPRLTDDAAHEYDAGPSTSIGLGSHCARATLARFLVTELQQPQFRDSPVYIRDR